MPSEKSERIMPRKKLSRNAPCPCGSGKKYELTSGQGRSHMKETSDGIFR